MAERFLPARIHPGKNVELETDLHVAENFKLLNICATKSLHASLNWPRSSYQGQGDVTQRGVKSDWTVSQASNNLNRLDKMITENKARVEELERRESEFRMKAENIHEQLEDFDREVQNLRTRFDYLRAKLAAERPSHSAVEERIRELIRFFI